jgi:membrane protein implicated in regulation of membrane protease activity
MVLRLQFGSVRALLTFIGFLLVFGILAGAAKSFPALNVLWVALWLVFLLLGSVAILFRMWRRRGNPDDYWRSAHRGGQIGFLPSTWQRWVLGEDQGSRRSSTNPKPGRG